MSTAALESASFAQPSRAFTVSRVAAVLSAEIGGIDLREKLAACSVANMRAALIAHQALAGVGGGSSAPCRSR